MPAAQHTYTGTHEGPCWWALYTRHQHEKIVARMLQSKGIEVSLPLYGPMRRWKDRYKLLSLPLFPGYLFVRLEDDSRLQVIRAPGVHMLPGDDEGAATVPEAEIDAIRKAVRAACPVEPHPFPRYGERARVKRGALEGAEGILVIKRSQDRLGLSVEMLAQSVGMEIDIFDVEPAFPHGEAFRIPASHDAGIGDCQAMHSA
jgi:transcription antitermination factor NusG